MSPPTTQQHLPSRAPRTGGAALPSLRLWLQSSSLLAVLAGYVLLLAFNQVVNNLQRQKAHRELVSQIAQSLPAAATGWPALPGLEVQRLSGGRTVKPQLNRQGGQYWMESTTPLDRPGGGDGLLRVRQNVTASVERQHLAQLLLVAAAGFSALLTGGLLRPVLRRGLVEPLAALGQQLDALQAPPAAPVLLVDAEQPSELRPIAAAFNAMQQRLGASWEQQRAFVDGVAHELRTPLTLISGHAQSLQRHAALATTPEASASLQLIASEAHRMGLLVSDLLDLARRDAGRLELRLQPLNPEDALLESFERLAASSQGRLQLLTSEMADGLPLALADPDRLQQCLAALIDNALRYSPVPRPVQLSAQATGDSVVLHVCDHGPGVASDEQERIFARFVRGGAAAGTRGSGIGLSIVRLLMEAMGGTVQVEQAPGGGADFQLRLRRV